MRHPEELLDDPGHRCSDYAIEQADNGQWRDRTDVLWIECGYNAGKQQTWHGDILANFYQHRDLAATEGLS